MRLRLTVLSESLSDTVRLAVEIATFCRAECTNLFSAQNSIGANERLISHCRDIQQSERNLENKRQNVREQTSRIILVQGMSVVSRRKVWEKDF